VREGWRHRWLFPFFAIKCVEKLYARTWLGVLWLPLRPGIDLLLKVAVIGTLIDSPSPGVPYLLSALVGMAVWELFEQLAFWSTRALEINRGLLRTVHVARLTVLTGALGPAGVFFAIYVAVTGVAAGYFVIVDGTTHFALGVETLGAVAGIVVAALLGLSVGLFLAPIAVQARDVRFVLAYVLGLWFFLTPVLYPVESLRGLLATAVTFNPMTAPVGMVKAGLLGTPFPGLSSMLVCVGTLALVIPAGLVFFGRSENAAMDSM